MAWHEIEPRPKQTPKAPVKVGITQRGTAYVVLGEGPQKYLAIGKGGRLRAEFGRGADRGKIRLTPVKDGGFPCGGPFRGVLRVSLGAIPDMRPGKMAAVACAYQEAPRGLSPAITVTLPPRFLLSDVEREELAKAAASRAA